MPWWRSAVPEADGLAGDEVFRRAELVTRGRYPTLAGGRRHRPGIPPRLSASLLLFAPGAVRSARCLLATRAIATLASEGHPRGQNRSARSPHYPCAYLMVI